MNKMKIFFIGIFLLLLIYVWFFLSEKPSNAKIKQQHIVEKTKPKQVTSNVKNILQVQTVSHSSAIEEKTLSSPLEEKQQLVAEMVDFVELSEGSSPRKYVKPLGALKIDMQKLTMLQVGDIFSLPNIDESDYQVVIDEADVMDGSQSFSGNFSDEGIHYSMIATVGEEGTAYIHLNTPKGAYEIEIDEGNGYIYRSSDIRQALSDESKDDALLVTLPEKNEQD